MSKVKLSDMPQDVQEHVRQWLQAAGSAGGRATGPRKARPSEVGRAAMRKRWGREQFIPEIVRRLLRWKSGQTTSQIRGKLAAKNIYCSASHLSRTLKSVGTKNAEGKWIRSYLRAK